LRRHDDFLGWTFEPNHQGRQMIWGREVDYAFDANGYRVRDLSAPLDPDRPSLLFAGESIIAGFGLNWSETIPAQVEAMTGLQSVNLGEYGYSTDQAYLRLKSEVPKFPEIRGIIMIFMPSLLDRDFRDDRPHLGPDLDYRPAEQRWRLAALLRWLVPYRSEAVLESRISTTRKVLQAFVALAESHHAVPLIIVPQFGPEDPREADLRRRVLDEGRLPYLTIPIDQDDHLPNDLHPNAHAAHLICIAIAHRIVQARTVSRLID